MSDLQNPAGAKYAQPLIITVKMDSNSHERLTGWRERFFPPARNYLTAHITLYHHLPAEHLHWIEKELTEFCRVQDAFPLSFHRVEHNGGFVSVLVDAPPLLHMKSHFDSVFGKFLKPQDQQKIRPHVTLVNKVSREEGKAASELIHLEFFPWQGRAEGLEIHFYHHGPWNLHSQIYFSS